MEGWTMENMEDKMNIQCMETIAQWNQMREIIVEFK